MNSYGYLVPAPSTRQRAGNTAEDCVRHELVLADAIHYGKLLRSTHRQLYEVHRASMIDGGRVLHLECSHHFMFNLTAELMAEHCSAQLAETFLDTPHQTGYGSQMAARIHAAPQTWLYLETDHHPRGGRAFGIFTRLADC